MSFFIFKCSIIALNTYIDRFIAGLLHLRKQKNTKLLLGTQSDLNLNLNTRHAKKIHHSLYHLTLSFLPS